MRRQRLALVKVEYEGGGDEGEERGSDGGGDEDGGEDGGGQDLVAPKADPAP